MDRKIIAIGGLTASGKTNISIKLARKFGNFEIINADSRQVYKKLDIGTAKADIQKRLDEKNYQSPKPVLINDVVHHLIDFVDLEEKFNLAKYQKLAYQKIPAIWSRKNIPVIVGGSGLYIDSVIYQFNLSEDNIDKSRRKQLQSFSLKKLQNILVEKDAKVFENLTPSDQKNKHRLIRRIEKLEQPKSQTQKPKHKKVLEDFEYLYLGLGKDIPREKLVSRINQRVNQMFDQGLLEENRQLREAGYTSKLKAFDTIGYQEFAPYFNGEKSLDEVRERIQINTRQYAKRQETWFKRNDDIKWITSYPQAKKLVDRFLKANQ
jgi:tRNA dimethylallyltransferase